MAFPSKLKNMNLFNEGASYLALAMSVTMPKLARKLEDYRAGGMDGTVKIDQGAEPMEMEFTLGGPDRTVIRQFARPGIAGTFLRFAGSYQNDATGAYDVIEITVRGRHEEIDMGESKVGEGGETKVKTQCAYYRLEWNGRVEIEIDVLNMIYIVDGVDMLAEQRAAIL
ncbi:phage major tail tube protein [Sphingomonas sp. LB2R24]|uniref:phage major tail tube protein n=1 Tax=Sphingomonas sorbitolis TaxID=3096165 RepID=UPI002FC5D37E